MQNNKTFNDYFIEIDEIKEIHEMKKYFQHGSYTTYSHCKQVAYNSYVFASRLKIPVDYSELIRGAFLHDFFLYDWHTPNDGHNLHAFSHPKTALKNANKLFDLTVKEKNIIESHMWPLTFNKFPKTKEAFIVCFVDKYCAITESLKYSKKVDFES